MKKKTSKKRENFKNQLSLSFLFTAGFAVIIHVCYFLFFVSNYVLENFVEPNTQQSIVFFIISPIFILAIGFLVAALFTYVMLSPLNEIMRAADCVAKGDYSVRVKPHGLGNLTELGEKFNHMAEEIGNVETLRSDFVNNFSHEFKTPIVSIRGFAKMLQRDDLTEEERQEYLNVIIKESERLTELSTNVLTISKLERQTILTDTKTYNVSEQIRLAIAMLDSKWADKNIEFSFDSEDSFITGNEELLDQVWINLLDNAIKFAPTNGSVRIESLQTSEKTTVLISNNGTPIPPEKAPFIFDKFYQSDDSHSTMGNGIGLAIVRKIVALHKGTVRLVKSDETETTFEVTVPTEEQKKLA